ncbi:hypothetical protein [Mycobacterium sp. IS-836]|uniref:hypothetical protein n=1 Tax=Mycobacterium sp. IS-836 TaxID=1834160 RepID=UPI00114F4E18|nr:hypothetical protein [Mycobacterium sp. IS-836]
MDKQTVELIKAGYRLDGDISKLLPSIADGEAEFIIRTRLHALRGQLEYRAEHSPAGIRSTVAELRQLHEAALEYVNG